MVLRSTHALPTEPLLDEPTARCARGRVSPTVHEWMTELAGEADLPARSARLFLSLRKTVDDARFVEMGRGILASSVRGEAAGVAALAAFLSVSAPGRVLIERVQEFSNLHRQIEVARRRRGRGEVLTPAEQSLISGLERVETELAAVYERGGAVDRADPRDRGPARLCRSVFASLVEELEETGTLGPESVGHLLRVARLEVDAMEQRASALACAIDPYSTRHVSQVMPILGSLDADLRDMRSFLDQLEETRRPSLFHRQRPSLVDVLEVHDEQKLRGRLEREPELQVLWRLLRGLDRNPVPSRMLAWFVDRLLLVGDRLTECGLRRRSIDVVAAALSVLDFHDQGVVELPASSPVVTALRERPVDGVHGTDSGLRVVFDAGSARRLALPLGLPLPAAMGQNASEDDKEDQTVKDLVLANINNTSVLLGLLKNQKVVTTPGVVALVVQRVRNMRVLETICITRTLHSGFANKDVPLALLRSPMNIPIKTLRRFVSVRYVHKIELRRLARDRSAVRREVAAEIEAYLKSLE